MERREEASEEGNASPYIPPEIQEGSSSLHLQNSRRKASLPSRRGGVSKSGLHSLLPYILPVISGVEKVEEYGRGEDDEGEVEEGVAPQDGAPEQRHHLSVALMVSILAQLES